jgi:hypothetical protein
MTEQPKRMVRMMYDPASRYGSLDDDDDLARPIEAVANDNGGRSLRLSARWGMCKVGDGYGSFLWLYS